MRRFSYGKRLLAFLVTAVMIAAVLSVVPQRTGTVYAEDGSPAVTAASGAELTEPAGHPGAPAQEPAGESGQTDAGLPEQEQVKSPADLQDSVPAAAGEAAQEQDPPASFAEVSLPEETAGQILTCGGNGAGAEGQDGSPAAGENVLTDVEEGTAENAAADAQGDLYYFDENGVEGHWTKWFRVESKDADDKTFTWNTRGHNRYAVHENEQVTYNRRVTVKGDVLLVLCDGASLTVKGGLAVPAGSSLTIYRQSRGTGKEASLTVTNVDAKCAGIGSSDTYEQFGTVTICGGKIDVTGGSQGAGIGSSSFSDTGTINIYGGTVRAQGGYWAAGLGGGGDSDGGTINIYDGNVTAIGGEYGAGIGGGIRKEGNSITIKGGTVNAYGGKSAAGIGGGWHGDAGMVTITDGVITAAGGVLTDTGGVPGDAQAIGRGKGASNSGNLVVGDAARGIYLKAGYVENETVRWANIADLNNVCRDRYSKIRLERCTFHGFDHTGKCGFCGAEDGPGTENTPYLDASGRETSAICEKVLASSAAWNDSGVSGGWYAAKGKITIPSRMAVSGTVNLVLVNGAELNAPKGINVPYGTTLVIWAQSMDEKTAGSLIISGVEQGNAGIGGGSGESGGTVRINGGVIRTAGGLNGAGIGGGSGCGSGTVEIGNGFVTARGGSYAAGIGGGYYGAGSTVVIAGGSVRAIGGMKAAGIGGGQQRMGGSVTITSGTVTVTAGSGNTQAIGHGESYYNNSSLVIDGMKVYDGEGAKVPVEAGKRAETCRKGGGATAVIRVCDSHDNSVYTDNHNKTHIVSCKYCGTVHTTEPHTYKNHVCEKCGAGQPTHTVTFYANNGTQDRDEQPVYDGEETPLKETGFTWADHEFNGWNTVRIPTADNPGTPYAADARVTLTDNLDLYGQWTEKPPAVLKSIRITTPPAIVYYTEGQNFDPAGMVVTATYTDGSKKAVTGYTWKPDGALDVTDISVTVRYTEDGITKTAKQAIVVNARDRVKEFVTRLYRVCLDREPDDAGLISWAEQLKSGKITGVKAAQGFIFSQEFKNKNYCNRHFVRQLYRAFMGREPDEGGWNNWILQLESGSTREAVFNGFALSPEFTLLCNEYGITRGGAIGVGRWGTVPTGPCRWEGCGEEDGVTQFVKRLYRVCLDRDADAGGLSDWTNQLWEHTSTGKKVAYGFVFSAEFRNKNYNNETFVDYMYLAFFDRAADAAGKADWVSQLNAGKSREAVFNGFADSREFTNLCAKYGILAR